MLNDAASPDDVAASPAPISHRTGIFCDAHLRHRGGDERVIDAVARAIAARTPGSRACISRAPISPPPAGGIPAHLKPIHGRPRPAGRREEAPAGPARHPRPRTASAGYRRPRARGHHRGPRAHRGRSYNRLGISPPEPVRSPTSSTRSAASEPAPGLIGAALDSPGVAAGSSPTVTTSTQPPWGAAIARPGRDVPRQRTPWPRPAPHSTGSIWAGGISTVAAEKLVLCGRTLAGADLDLGRAVAVLAETVGCHARSGGSPWRTSVPPPVAPVWMTLPGRLFAPARQASSRYDPRNGNGRSASSGASDRIVEYQPATIDIDRLAGDVARLRACEKRHDVADLARRADPAEGRARQDPLPWLRGWALTPAIISVSIEPGPTAFTRMLCGASARAATFVSCATPPFEAQ